MPRLIKISWYVLHITGWEGFTIKPIIVEDLCIGCGICETICPEVFELRDDGLAYVIDESPSDDLKEAVEEAVEACPSEAIELEE